ncbi:hypothetical protein JCGZ_24950 [Jatropha curcas]|uniref:BHLH domain-containing protein n=1 Tax=Jatropha curcas TaxID=180498 RepID=A0A067KXL1_JATCU|nr:transcription factor bHLH143 [Jatropha curcas]XP_020533949.1 transcription factor bHLH143 [Jatropha curcas]KDP40951.1 hypothetical protein JCGZ_24950 [Jatropha curcas]
MVKTNNPWLFPPRFTLQLPDFNFMSTSVEPVQPGCLPAYVNPGTYTFSANMTTAGVVVPSLPSSKAQQNNGAQGLPRPPSIQNLVPTINPYLRENLSVFSNGFPGEVPPNAVPGCQRKFVIFDQSGNETKLIYSSFFPTATKPITDSFMRYEEHAAAKMDQINFTVPKLQEVSDENHLSGEESEMHEDTEEINALLYLDDSGYDDGGDDDEVTSTGHSPSLIRSYGMRGQVEEMTEEVADSDCQNKRQKLLDGGYKRSSLANTCSLTKVAGVHRCDDDAKSSYVIGQNREEEMVAIFGNKRLKKDEVCATLKVLESIIPGAKDKDPLLVLDIAIDYLNSLKHEAKNSRC